MYLFICLKGSSCELNYAVFLGLPMNLFVCTEVLISIHAVNLKCYLGKECNVLCKVNSAAGSMDL